ncbi:MAG: DUF86 domain-containing protein [Chloroflexi bacterium]|nr:DUF86 domain-containing protein [Chloroflexota bacterium]
MLTYAEKAEAFVAGVDLEGFRNDEQKAFAVVRALEVIGEAARHIPAVVRKRYPEVPWEKIVGMRNILVHGYFGIDLEVIRRTVQEDLPPLRQAIARILQSQAQST